MRSVVIFLAFVTTSTFGQKSLDFGEIKDDQAFCVSANPTDTNNICNSKNLLEIWLSIHSLDKEGLSSGPTLVKLQFDGFNWKGFKYTHKFKEIESDSYKGVYQVDKKIGLKPMIRFDSLFMVLKENNIFTLPDQRFLVTDSVPNAGSSVYNVTFKARDKFRSYWFFNLETNKSKYKKLHEFENYDNITKAFVNFMIPE